MKTDDLIVVLGTNVGEEFGGHKIVRAIFLVAAASAAVVLLIAILFLGFRSDLVANSVSVSMFLKIMFAVTIAFASLFYLGKAARPGGERSIRYSVAVLPFVAITLLGAASLWAAPTEHWQQMLMGEMWLECLLSIPIIAIVPFVSILWIVKRTSAPTDLVKTGALIGLAAGAVSAMGYALHCVDDTVPFVALWYGGTIAICSLAGALVGPRYLRW